MAKIIRPANYLMMCVLFTLRAFGQLQNTGEAPREEVFVHADRNAYIAGEILWFKVYVVDRKTQKPSVSRIVYVELLDGQNRPALQQRVLLDDGSGPGQLILPDTLTSGTYLLRAYTSWMKNFMPYNCFMEEILIFNATGSGSIAKENETGNPVYERYLVTPDREKELFTVATGEVFHFRDPITLEIRPAESGSGRMDSANLSISVAPLTGDFNAAGIGDYTVSGPEYDAEIKFPMESSDHFLEGRLDGADRQPGKQGELLILCIPRKQAGFQYTFTGSQGSFRFGIPIDEEVKDLVLMPDTSAGIRKISVKSPFSDRYLPALTRPEDTVTVFPSYLAKWSVNYQVRAIYGLSSLGGVLNPAKRQTSPVRFYGKPDIELIMADYIKLPLMEEVFFELLPNVSLRKRKNEYVVSITDRIDNALYVTNPVVMIDGVIIRDPSLIIGLDPGMVEKIDVIKGRYHVGSYTFPGLVNVITKAGDFNSVPLPGYMTRLPYRATDPAYAFVFPDYSDASKKNSRIPDYRTTLYWNPSVITDHEGKARITFYAADNQADYLIKLQGITKDGRVFSQRKIVQVR